MAPKNLKQLLNEMLTEEEKKHIVRSFDVIGKIAVIEIPEELKHKEKQIAEAILQVHSNVKTVCRRAGHHQGEFRVRPVEVIAGEQTTETYYTEAGAKMHLDMNEVYFTPRLNFERNRIANQVQEGETLGCWFAGVGPFALVIFKKQPKVKIYAIELNPKAYKFLEENIRINKSGMAIIPVLGDVREESKDHPKLDRVVMPLPKGGEDFLGAALDSVKPGGMIHFYQFSSLEDPFTQPIGLVKSAAEKANRTFEVVNKKIVRPFSPSVVQVVLDIKVQ